LNNELNVCSPLPYLIPEQRTYDLRSGLDFVTLRTKVSNDL